MMNGKTWPMMMPGCSYNARLWNPAIVVFFGSSELPTDASALTLHWNSNLFGHQYLCLHCSQTFFPAATLPVYTAWDRHWAVLDCMPRGLTLLQTIVIVTRLMKVIWKQAASRRCSILPIRYIVPYHFRPHYLSLTIGYLESYHPYHLNILL